MIQRTSEIFQTRNANERNQNTVIRSAKPPIQTLKRMTDQDLGIAISKTRSQRASLEASEKPKAAPNSILGGTIPLDQPLRWEAELLQKNKE